MQLHPSHSLCAAIIQVLDSVCKKKKKQKYLFTTAPVLVISSYLSIQTVIRWGASVGVCYQIQKQNFGVSPVEEWSFKAFHYHWVWVPHLSSEI